MTTLASPDDFAVWFGLGLNVESLTNTEQARITTALEIASGIVRSGRRIFSRVTDDVVNVDGSGGCDILLPSDRLPVVSVSSVTNLALWDTEAATVTAAEYDWTPSGLLHLHRDAAIGAYWTPRRQGVVVTYTHGYDPIPQDVAGVVLAIAKRWYDAASAGSTASGSLVKAESLGDYSVTYDTASSGLLESEAFVLRQYETPA